MNKDANTNEFTFTSDLELRLLAEVKANQPSIMKGLHLALKAVELIGNAVHGIGWASKVDDDGDAYHIHPVLIKTLLEANDIMDEAYTFISSVRTTAIDDMRSTCGPQADLAELWLVKAITGGRASICGGTYYLVRGHVLLLESIVDSIEDHRVKADGLFKSLRHIRQGIYAITCGQFECSNAFIIFAAMRSHKAPADLPSADCLPDELTEMYNEVTQAYGTACYKLKSFEDCDL